MPLDQYKIDPRKKAKRPHNLNYSFNHEHRIQNPEQKLKQPPLHIHLGGSHVQPPFTAAVQRGVGQIERRAPQNQVGAKVNEAYDTYGKSDMDAELLSKNRRCARLSCEHVYSDHLPGPNCRNFAEDNSPCSCMSYIQRRFG